MQGYFRPGLRHTPHELVLDQPVRWHPIPPCSFTLDKAMAGGTFKASLTPEFVVEVRVFAETPLPGVVHRYGDQGADTLWWGYRTLGAMHPRLMQRRGKVWHSVRNGVECPGGWHVFEERLDASGQCVIACSAIGERLGPLSIPLPGQDGTPCPTDVAGLARDAAGMPLSADAE
jgi:hypothetical protein